MGKDPGWRLPTVIDPETRKAVCICIPDELNHIMAFWGALRQLAYWFNWERNDAHDGLPVSLVWAQIVNEAHDKWIAGVMCTSCDDLIACLQPLMDEINAKLDSIQGGVNNIQWGKDNEQPGVPLDEDALNEDQAGDSNPTCDLDILWSQCLQLVQYTNQLIVDALEAAESATNGMELVDVISGFPGIDEVGADVVAGYIALLQDGISENYISEYNETLEQEIACLIFCAAQANCEITIELVDQVYHDKVGEFFMDLPSAFSTLGAFMSYFVDQNIGSDVVVYALHYMIWAGGALANIFLGDIGTKSLQTLLLLAANDPSSDWEVLCEECPAPWEVDFPGELPFSTFTPLTQSGAVTTIDADSIDGHTDTANTAVFLKFQAVLDGDISKIEFDVAWAFNTPFQQFILSDESGTIQSFNLNGTSPATFTAEFTRSGSHTYTVLAGVQGTEAAARYLRVTGMRWSGLGDNPFS